MIAPAANRDSVLREMVTVLAERLCPELILLFGSRARGDARDDSDYDLLLVMSDNVEAESARKTAHSLMWDMRLSVDVLAHSASVYLRHQRDPGFIDWLIAREGVLLYSTGNVPQLLPAQVRERPGERDSLAMWLDRASGEALTAERLLDYEEPLIDGICFHAHAAVEKWLKALVVVHSHKFPPKTHELDKLLAFVPAFVAENKEILRACKVLMDVYPKPRYAEERPTLDEAVAAIAAMRAVRGIVLAEMERP